VAGLCVHGPWIAEIVEYRGRKGQGREVLGPGSRGDRALAEFCPGKPARVAGVAGIADGRSVARVEPAGSARISPDVLTRRGSHVWEGRPQSPPRMARTSRNAARIIFPATTYRCACRTYMHLSLAESPSGRREQVPAGKLSRRGGRLELVPACRGRRVDMGRCLQHTLPVRQVHESLGGV
jgi:hypothetical protein